MSNTISAALPAYAWLATVPSTEDAASASAGQSGTTANQVSANATQEAAALNRVLGGYRAGIAEGLPVAALTSLARQVAADAKLTDHNVQLLHAATAAATSAAQANSNPVSGGRINTFI